MKICVRPTVTIENSNSSYNFSSCIYRDKCRIREYVEQSILQNACYQTSMAKWFIKMLIAEHFTQLINSMQYITDQLQKIKWQLYHSEIQTLFNDGFPAEAKVLMYFYIAHVFLPLKVGFELEHYVCYVRVRTDSIFLEYRSLLFYV